MCLHKHVYRVIVGMHVFWLQSRLQLHVRSGMWWFVHAWHGLIGVWPSRVLSLKGDVLQYL